MQKSRGYGRTTLNIEFWGLEEEAIEGSWAKVGDDSKVVRNLLEESCDYKAILAQISFKCYQWSRH